MAIDLSRTFKPVNIALLTVSDTRGPEDDTSGDILADRIKGAGHHLVARAMEKAFESIWHDYCRSAG